MEPYTVEYLELSAQRVVSIDEFPQQLMNHGLGGPHLGMTVR